MADSDAAKGGGKVRLDDIAARVIDGRVTL